MILTDHPSVMAVYDAYTIPGPHPVYHNTVRDILHREWPTLALALDQLEADVRTQELHTHTRIVESYVGDKRRAEEKEKEKARKEPRLLGW